MHIEDSNMFLTYHDAILGVSGALEIGDTELADFLSMKAGAIGDMASDALERDLREQGIAASNVDDFEAEQIEQADQVPVITIPFRSISLVERITEAVYEGRRRDAVNEELMESSARFETPERAAERAAAYAQEHRGFVPRLRLIRNDQDN